MSVDLDIRVLASSSKANCTYIDDGISPLLLDAGLPLREIKRGLNFQTSRLAAALITHSHQDHCRGVKELVKAGIDCYMTAPTAQAVGVNGHRVQIIRPLEQFEICPWAILPFDTIHDAEGSVGFLLAHKAGAKVLYLTDTMYCPYKFNGLTHILIECNYALDILRENVAAGRVDFEHKRRVMRSHMSLETVLGFLRANDLSQVREIWLLHCSSENSDVGLFKSKVQAATGKPTLVGQRNPWGAREEESR